MIKKKKKKPGQEKHMQSKTKNHIHAFQYWL